MEIKNNGQGMVMQFIKFKSAGTEEDVLEMALARVSQFEAIPGLVQKYYIKDQATGEYGGVYIWDSMESLQAYRQSELAASIPQAYQIDGQPQVTTVEVFHQLRD